MIFTVVLHNVTLDIIIVLDVLKYVKRHVVNNILITTIGICIVMI